MHTIKIVQGLRTHAFKHYHVILTEKPDELEVNCCNMIWCFNSIVTILILHILIVQLAQPLCRASLLQLLDIHCYHQCVARLQASAVKMYAEISSKLGVPETS